MSIYKLNEQGIYEAEVFWYKNSGISDFIKAVDSINLSNCDNIAIKLSVIAEYIGELLNRQSVDYLLMGMYFYYGEHYMDIVKIEELPVCICMAEHYIGKKYQVLKLEILQYKEDLELIIDYMNKQSHELDLYRESKEVTGLLS